MHPPDDSPLHVIKIEFAQRLPCATLACSRGRLFCELRVCELRVCELRVCKLRVASLPVASCEFSILGPRLFAKNSKRNNRGFELYFI